MTTAIWLLIVWAFVGPSIGFLIGTAIAAGKQENAEREFFKACARRAREESETRGRRG